MEVVVRFYNGWAYNFFWVSKKGIELWPSRLGACTKSYKLRTDMLVHVKGEKFTLEEFIILFNKG